MEKTTKILQLPIKLTLPIPVRWIRAVPFVKRNVEAIEGAVFRYDCSCKTKLIKTGWFSADIYFEITGEKEQLVRLFEFLKVWAETTGIGWSR